LVAKENDSSFLVNTKQSSAAVDNIVRQSDLFDFEKSQQLQVRGKNNDHDTSSSESSNVMAVAPANRNYQASIVHSLDSKQSPEFQHQAILGIRAKVKKSIADEDQDKLEIQEELSAKDGNLTRRTQDNTMVMDPHYDQSGEGT